MKKNMKKECFVNPHCVWDCPNFAIDRINDKYGHGYVRYELTKNGSAVPLDTLTQTTGLADVEFDKSVMLAIPMMIYSSGTYEGRGRSIFDSKCDNFDICVTNGAFLQL